MLPQPVLFGFPPFSVCHVGCMSSFFDTTSLCLNEKQTMGDISLKHTAHTHTHSPHTQHNNNARCSPYVHIYIYTYKMNDHTPKTQCAPMDRRRPVPVNWDVILVEQEAKATDRTAVEEVLAADLRRERESWRGGGRNPTIMGPRGEGGEGGKEGRGGGGGRGGEGAQISSYLLPLLPRPHETRVYCLVALVENRGAWLTWLFHNLPGPSIFPNGHMN